MKIKNNFYLIILILVLLIPTVDLFRNGLPLTHDGQDHVARIANFYQNLIEGNVVPRWAGNLNWGYGHPILEFLYPFPSYLASLFHWLGFGLVNSVKLVFGLSFILSGVTMYLFIKELFKNEKTALFSGLLYTIAPYRFVDLYVRGAIGEHVAFIFPPLIFYCLLKLSKKYSITYLISGVISLTGLILSHNAITIMFLPLIFLYILFLFFNSFDRKKFIFSSLLLIFLGFCFSAFFWIPAFFEGKYTLRDIVTSGGEYLAGFVSWKDFFSLSWSYGGTLFLSKQIGLIQWIIVFGSLIMLIKSKKNGFRLIIFICFLLFWITLFLMTFSSNFIWEKITILQKFQFPWRFLSVIVFLSSLMGGFFLYSISDKLKKITLIIFMIFIILANKDYWHPQGFLQKSESFYSGIYDSTTDTGESAPIWSVRFMEKRPKSRIEIIDGKAEIRELKRTVIKRQYEIDALEKTRILENTLYFPGWIVMIDGKQADVEFQDQAHRGLITFYLDKGKHNVDIVYTKTKIRKIADNISLISLVLMIGIFTFNFSSKKRYN